MPADAGTPRQRADRWRAAQCRSATYPTPQPPKRALGARALAELAGGVQHFARSRAPRVRLHVRVARRAECVGAWCTSRHAPRRSTENGACISGCLSLHGAGGNGARRGRTGACGLVVRHVSPSSGVQRDIAVRFTSGRAKAPKGRGRSSRAEHRAKRRWRCRLTWVSCRHRTNTLPLLRLHGCTAARWQETARLNLPSASRWGGAVVPARKCCAAPAGQCPCKTQEPGGKGT